MVNFQPVDLDGTGIDLLKEERHVSLQRAGYCVELPSWDAAGAFLIIMRLLVGNPDQLGQPTLGYAYYPPAPAYPRAYVSVYGQCLGWTPSKRLGLVIAAVPLLLQEPGAPLTPKDANARCGTAVTFQVPVTAA